MAKKKYERDFYLTEKECKKFIRIMYERDIKYGLLFEVILYGGLRVSEALFITPSDISESNQSILISTLKRKYNQPKIEIKYPYTVIKKLILYIKAMKIRPEDRIFNITRQAVWKYMKKVLKKHKDLRNTWSPHALRHSHGVMVADITKGDTIAIAKRLRHSTLSTVSVYTHLTEKMQKKIVDGIEKIMKKEDLNE